MERLTIALLVTTLRYEGNALAEIVKTQDGATQMTTDYTYDQQGQLTRLVDADDQEAEALSQILGELEKCLS